MNFERKIDNICNMINEPKLLNDYNCHVLLDISEPLMFTLNQLDEYYLAYVMQNNSILLDNKKADVMEILIVHTTFLEIKNLLEGKTSIKDSLSSSKEAYRVGKIGSKVFPKKLLNNVNVIENKIPRENVFIDKTLPNKIDIKRTLGLIEELYDKYSQFCINSKAKTREEIINVDHYEFEVKTNYINEKHYKIKTFDMKSRVNKWM